MVIIYHLKSTATTSGTDQFDFGNPFWRRYRSEEISPRELPSCTDDILEWDEEEVGFEKCQEVSFRGASLLCGINGTKEITRKFRLGGGTVEEVVESTSCKDCGDLSAALAWTAWTFCGRAAEAMLCRRRGNADIGFEEEGEL